MRRTAILLGAGLLFALPATDLGLRLLSGRAALAAIDAILADRADLTAGARSFDLWRGTLNIENLDARSADLSIRIAHLTYAPKATGLRLVTAAFAQQNEPSLHGFSAAVVHAAEKTIEGGTVSADDITIDSNDATYKIPHIEFTGTDLTGPDLTALFDAKNTSPLSERFARISAARIAVPEITAKLKNATTGDVAYRDIELRDVVKGRAAEGTIKIFSANIVATEGATVAVSCGPIDTKDFDIAQNAKLVSETGKPGDVPQPLYASLTASNCKITSDNKTASGNAQTVVEIERISAADAKARPLTHFLASAKEVFDADRQDADDPDLAAKRSAYLADLYAAFEAGLIEMNKVRFGGTTSDGALFSGSFAKISMTKFAASTIGEIRFDDFALDANGTKSKLGTLAMRGIHLANVVGRLNASQAAAPKPLPVLDQFLLAELDVDTAYDKSDPTAHGRFQLAKFDLTGTTSDDGVPKHFSAALDHVIVDLGALKSIGIETSNIAGLGYDSLDMSSRLVMSFDAAKKELALDDLSLSGKNMGGVKLTGQFSNVGQEAFSADQTVAEAALFAAAVNRIELRLENAGLFEKIIADTAKKEGKTPDEIRRDYIADISVGIPNVLENGRGAKVIAEALAKFVAAPKTFHLIARAPAGFGAAEFALIKEPAALLEKLEIEATANE